MMKYKIVIYDEEENRQEVVTTDRGKAMECANANRWATIFTC